MAEFTTFSRKSSGCLLPTSSLQPPLRIKPVLSGHEAPGFAAGPALAKLQCLPTKPGQEMGAAPGEKTTDPCLVLAAFQESSFPIYCLLLVDF